MSNDFNLYDMAEELCHARGLDPQQKVSDPCTELGHFGVTTREELAVRELEDFKRKLQLFGLLPEET